MNFLLSPEQNEMQRSVLRYLNENLDTVKLHKLFDKEEFGDYDAALWRGLADLGVLGIAVPEADAGLGLEMLDLALVAETLGSRAAPLPFLGQALATLAIAWAGSGEQKGRWLPGLIDGSVIATVGLSGGSNRWDAEAWSASPNADTLSGSWPLVPDAAQAHLYVLGLAGGELVVVERSEAVSISAQPSNDRTRPLGTVSVKDSVFERLPGGTAQATRLHDAALLLLAADAFGGATRCHELATAYAKERVQFGQPIGQFQAVKHQLADMVIAVEPARGLYWYAAHAFDHREPAERSQVAALAKAHIADLYVAAARRCVELHGGMGYTWELDVHIYLKRAMFDHAFMGMPALLRSKVAELSGW